MTQNDYARFLESKTVTAPVTGISFEPTLSDQLFPFQADIVRWALKRGRATSTPLDETQFQEVWSKVIDVVCQEILPGITEVEIEVELQKCMGLAR